MIATVATVTIVLIRDVHVLFFFPMTTAVWVFLEICIDVEAEEVGNNEVGLFLSMAEVWIWESFLV